MDLFIKGIYAKENKDCNIEEEIMWLIIRRIMIMVMIIALTMVIKLYCHEKQKQKEGE